MRLLDTLAWLAVIVYCTVPSYWLVVHGPIQYWRDRNARLSRLGLLWFAMWIAVGAITAPWRHVVLYRNPWLWIPGGALFATGLYIYWRALRGFSTDQVLGRSELQPSRHEQRLNTAGIRGMLRHPLYLGHLCEMLGWSVSTGLAVCYAMTLFAVITGIFMVRAEERELVGRFGQRYRDYQREVPAIWPR